MIGRTPLIVIWVVIIVLCLMLAAQCSSRADDGLPGGITCDQVVHYAGEFNIPNTTAGRVRARIIAAALGIPLTSAQLDAAAKCLASRGVQR